MFIHQNRDARFDSIFSKETEEKLNVGLSLKSMIADFFLMATSCYIYKCSQNVYSVLKLNSK